YRTGQPTRIRFVDQGGRFHWRPFVYGLKATRDPITFQFRYEEDPSRIYPLRFFTPGEPYRLFGVIPMRVRLVGLEPGSDGRLFLLGTDRFGRDLWGRILDRKSTRLNSSHVKISYAVFCLKKKRKK